MTNPMIMLERRLEVHEKIASKIIISRKSAQYILNWFEHYLYVLGKNHSYIRIGRDSISYRICTVV